MPAETNIVEKTAEFVFNLFKERLPEYLVYHSYSHSALVAREARKIGKGVKLGEEGIEVVTLAAWLHDTGYTEIYPGHEEISVRIATDFLQKEDYPFEKIELINGCIRATKVPQSPQNLLEEVVADADLSGLGKKSFFEKNELLRIEWEKALGRVYTDQEWANQNLDFLTGHRYFTRFAQEIYEDQRNENIRFLHKKIRKIITPKDEVAIAKIEIKREKLARSVEKEAKPERGTETMFRILSYNHMMLNMTADRKAQTLIRSNAFIIVACIALLFSSFGVQMNFVLPVFMLLGVSVLTIFFSVLAMRPKIWRGYTSREDIENRRSNLLYFGNYYTMPFEDFDWGIKEMMRDKDFLYSSLTRDCFYLGKAIGKKYRYLNTGYTIFMYGLAVTVLTFLIIYLYSIM